MTEVTQVYFLIAPPFMAGFNKPSKIRALAHYISFYGLKPRVCGVLVFPALKGGAIENSSCLTWINDYFYN